MGIDIGGETQLITCQVKGDRAKVADCTISPSNCQGVWIQSKISKREVTRAISSNDDYLIC